MDWTLTALSESGGGEGLEQPWDLRGRRGSSHLPLWLQSHMAKSDPILVLDAWLRDAALQSH